MTIVGSLFVLTLFVLPNVPAYTAGGVPAENDDVRACVHAEL